MKLVIIIDNVVNVILRVFYTNNYCRNYDESDLFNNYCILV